MPARDSTGLIRYSVRCVCYLVSAADGWYEQGGDAVLPLGTVTVQETKAPEGYVLTDDSGKIVKTAPVHIGLITENSIKNGESPTWQNWKTTCVGVTDMLYQGRAQTDNTNLIPISLAKTDSDSGDGGSQGDGTLAGAKFTLWNRSKNRIEVTER